MGSHWIVLGREVSYLNLVLERSLLAEWVVYWKGHSEM